MSYLASPSDVSDVRSLISEDEAASVISRFEDSNTEIVNIFKKSALDPQSLIGWKISVKLNGTGVIGVVTGIKKRFGMSTLHSVLFEDGSTQLLALKRAKNKGVVSFTPIGKAADPY